MIETQELTRRYNGVTAVEELTISIARGEVFGLLGPNGAGKTTTVRMLAGLIAPSSGTASVNGLALSGDKLLLRSSVGILTENPGLYERLSVRVNIEFFARLYGLEGPRLAAQVDKYLQLLDLGPEQHRVAGKLSRGMQQKVALARALIHEPPVLFLDEPTSNLDPESARTVRNTISALRAEQRCIVLCTHNLKEAEALCDRIGILKRRLLCVDGAANLRRNRQGRQVVIRLAVYEQQYCDLASQLPFVQRCEQDENSLVVHLEDPEKNNPRLLQELLAVGAPVQFVSERRPTLEQIYLDLVGYDNGHA